MRVALGIDGELLLIVSITQERGPTDFDFYVVNGGWTGVYRDGIVTCSSPDGPVVTSTKYQILTAVQDRLRGDYRDVFENFDDENYVAPKPVVLDRFDDDDIPF